MTHDDPTDPLPDGDPQPSTYVLHAMLTMPGPWPEAKLREGVDAFLAELARSLRAQGCGLIGHIKGVLEEEEGLLFFSVTSFEQRPRFKGGLTGRSEKMDLRLNVIVYGVGKEAIEALVLGGLRKHLGEVSQDNR